VLSQRLRSLTKRHIGPDVLHHVQQRLNAVLQFQMGLAIELVHKPFVV
jgi:hypothetical protein